MVSEQLAGPPLGGLLFAAAAAVPFLLDAGSFAAAAVLIAALRGRFRVERPAAAPPTTLRAEIAEGSAGCGATDCCASSRWPWG
jgi:hypothetical protein